MEYGRLCSEAPARRVVSWVGFFLLFGASTGLSASGAQVGDPTTDPFPTFDFDEPKQKSIVVSLDFQDQSPADLQSVEVVRERTHVRVGNPPLLRVRVLDLSDGVIEEFNEWHPLWTLSYGGPKIVAPAATGRIAFPFAPLAAQVTVVDKTEDDALLATVDLLPATHDFCRNNPDELDCEGLANRTPVCDADGAYVAECTGQFTIVTLDGTASTDPDQDPLAYEWSGSFEEGTAEGAMPEVTFAGLGSSPLSLEVWDEFGGSDMCESVATVVDTTPPVIDCNSPEFIRPPDAPISFTPMAQDVCDGDITPMITGYDCYAVNPGGKRVDKTDSCVVEFAGDQVTIVDSGGLLVTIEWTVAVADSTGNANETTCSLYTAHPVRTCGVARSTSAPVWGLVILLLLAVRIRASAKPRPSHMV